MSLPRPRPVAYASLCFALAALFPISWAAWVGWAALIAADPLDEFQLSLVGSLLLGGMTLSAERGSRWSGLRTGTRNLLRFFVRLIVWLPILLAIPAIGLLAAGFSHCAGHDCTKLVHDSLVIAAVFAAIGLLFLIGAWRYLREPVPATQAP